MTPEYYLVWQDTTPGPYTLQEIILMLERNQISASYEVIHHGKKMLVSELLQSLPPNVVAGARYVPAFPETYFYILEPLMFALGAFTLITICVEMLTLFVSPMAGVVQCLVLPLHILCSIAYVVFFYIWIYRVHMNARAFGATDLWFTPPWTIISWFIPFINLVWPFMIIREISQASKDPSNWRAQPSTLVFVWWGLTYLIIFISLCLSVGLLIYSGGAQDFQALVKLFQDKSFIRMNQLIRVPITFLSIVSLGITWMILRNIHNDQAFLIKNGRPAASQ